MYFLVLACVLYVLYTSVFLDLIVIGPAMLVPVAARSKVWVCGRSPAEIVGSNPTGGHGYLSVVSVVRCQVGVSATH